MSGTHNDNGAVEQANDLHSVGSWISSRYEVLAIHKGAMGVVYAVLDHKLLLPFALKTIQPQYARNRALCDLFQEEATAWVGLGKHPNIVQAHSVEIFSYQPFVLTDYISGSNGAGNDLRGWIGRQSLTIPQSLRFAHQIAQGMAYAVSRNFNFVHRDLKPANILVDGRPRAMVSDFGLVASKSPKAGTPLYKAPEQWRGDILTPRTDFYAFGCILYEMAVGRPPFQPTSLRELEEAHLNQKPIRPRSRNPNLNDLLNELILQCLEKAPEQRPKSWEEISRACSACHREITGHDLVESGDGECLSDYDWVGVSYSLINLKRWQEAVAACDRAIQSSSNSQVRMSALMNKGWAFLGIESWEQSLMCFNDVLKVERAWSPAWLGRGDALSALKDQEGAIKSFDEALATDPGNVFALARKAQELWHMRRLDEAAATCHSALILKPSLAEAWYTLGLIHKQKGEISSSVESLSKSVECNPYDWTVWTTLGCALREQKRFEEALKAFREALAQKATHEPAMMGQGMVLEDLDRIHEAIQVYERLLSIYPKHAHACFALAGAFWDIGNKSAALNSYDRGLRLAPETSFAWKHRGLLLQEMGRHAEAMVSLKRGSKEITP